MIIAFIGNCQTASLTFYFQQLLDCNIQWLLYGEEFRGHLTAWSDKVKNKVLDYNISLDIIKNSDFIIYQEICKEKSEFSNSETLNSIKKDACILIKIPSIYLDYSDYDNSIEELKKREIQNSVDITVSDIFENNRDKILLRGLWHPTTFLFLEIIDKICKLMNIDTFSSNTKETFLQDDNYMALP